MEEHRRSVENGMEGGEKGGLDADEQVGKQCKDCRKFHSTDDVRSELAPIMHHVKLHC